MAVVPGLEIHTRNLTAGQSMTLDGSEGVTMVSYQMSGAEGDSGTVTGTISFKASSDASPVASQAQAIPANGGNVFISVPTKPFIINIACVQGTLKVQIGR